jgi:hypothetical protein
VTTYRKIKTMLRGGILPSATQLDRAIAHQTIEIAGAAASLAKHTAKLIAAAHHPFPLPEDQEGRVARRLRLVELEQNRLVKLFLWKELIAKAPRTAPAGVGSNWIKE